MADQRGTDLTWGQLGEATYDAVEKKWSFLRQPVLPNLLQPTQPLKQCLPAPSSTEQEETKDDDVREVTRKRKDWRTSQALRSFSDLGGAASFLKTLERPKEEEKAARSSTGDVMATGVAKLRSVTNKGYRGFPVVAASFGEGGHVLRISKPRFEDRTWTNHTDDKIRLLDLERSEHGYWSAGAAAIEQVTFAIDTEGLQTWLAVRHASSTTVMRPMVHPFPVAQNVPKYMLNEYPPSRIDSNVACTITTEATRGNAHVDVAFNPWYTRQFAILDEAGYWKTWNIEGIHSGSKTAAKGKEGYIYDDPGLHDAAPQPEDTGWGRLIWVSDVATIVISNLRHVAMFAIGREVTKLNCPRVIPKGSTGRILDMKRSPVWHDKFFILTDSRLFLLDTMAAGCQIIMSTPHFREAQSADLKLELHGRDETCTALLYSANTGLVNVYNFKLDTDAPTPVTWTTDAFHLPELDNGSPPKDIQGLCVLPAAEPPERWNKNRDGRWYNPNQFYQAFILSKDFAISQTLLAEGDLIAGQTADKPAMYETVGAPDTGKLVPEKIKTAKGDEKVDELVAIVPDGLPEDAIEGPPRPNFWELKKAATKPEVLVKKSDAINAQTWYELATAQRPFTCRTKQGQCRGHATPQAKPCNGENLQEGDLIMEEYVQKILDNAQRRKEVEQQGLTTMRDLSEFSRFTEDIDDGAKYLGDFIGAFGDDDESSNVAINLRACYISAMLETRAGKAAEGSMTDMSKVYDKVVELYLASLPAETPGEVRIAKERMIRNIAADVTLSSLMVHVQEKPKATESRSTDLAEAFKSSQFAQSQAIGSQRGHFPSATPDPNLPSSQPSIDGGMVEQYSQLLTPDPSVAGSQMGESAEDPSITLLRSYALQVKTQRPLGKTRADILNTWELGSDINNFHWKAPDLYGSVEAADEEDAEEIQAKQEREQRREHKERRKIEKEIRRQHRYSMLPQSQEIYSPNPSGLESQRKAKRKSFAFGSQFSQSQTPGFGTPIAKKPSRKSMGAYPSQTQSQGGGWGGGGGSQTPTVGVSTGTPIPRPGTSAGNSFGAASQGGASTTQVGISTGAASQGAGAGASFGTSFGSQPGMPMTQPVLGAFGGRRSLGGRHSLGGLERKRRKGF